MSIRIFRDKNTLQALPSDELPLAQHSDFTFAGGFAIATHIGTAQSLGASSNGTGKLWFGIRRTVDGSIQELNIPALETDPDVSLWTEATVSQAARNVMTQLSTGIPEFNITPTNSTAITIKGNHDLTTLAYPTSPVDGDYWRGTSGTSAHYTIGDYSFRENDSMLYDADHWIKISGANSGQAMRIGHIYDTGSELICSIQDVYDAAGNLTYDTHIIIEDPTNIATSDVRGRFNMENRFTTSFWTSPIPTEWQTDFGGHDTLYGSSENWSIGGNHPQGYSFTSGNLSDLITNNVSGTYSQVPNTVSMNYPLSVKKLQEDHLDRQHGKEHMFKDSEWAPYGFIIPNTRTYMVVGSIAGFTSKAKYKGLNENLLRNDGPLVEDPMDWHAHYWLYDMREILDAYNGTIGVHEIWPYQYNELDILPSTMFPTYTKAAPPPWRAPYSATFDPRTNELYLLCSHSSATTDGALVAVIDITAFP